MTEPGKPQVLFPTVLASTVHDIKNSLGIVLELIRQLALKKQPGQSGDFTQLEFEANRINHSLMQLLVMYKIDSSKFGLEIDEYFAMDIVNEAKAQQEMLAKFKGIRLLTACDDGLICYCDYANICNALGTVLNNALRYARSAVNLSVAEEEGYLKFCIEDDGQGYPEHLLQTDFTALADLDWVKGHSGLGLYFVSVIAAMHKEKEKNGFVKLDNRSRMGGARFCLFLP